MRGLLKFYTESRRAIKVGLTEQILCGVEPGAGELGFPYLLCRVWILGQG